MLLEKVSLFSSKKDFFIFILFCLFILSYSLFIEYNNFKNLTKFDSNYVDATLLKFYSKTKTTKKGKIKTYKVLKLKADKDFGFYTTTNKKLSLFQGKKMKLELWAGKISFYEYMTSFYAYSKIKDYSPSSTLKEKLNIHIDASHKDKEVTSVYQALYTATSLPKELQLTFSKLGISHLFAISGFHLGVLSGLLFFLLRYPYKFLQNLYFPYRSYKLDSFLIIAFLLFVYLLFLDTPPSLLRAFVMLLIGFVLFDRGFKIVSMWTLFLTIVLILSFTPRLFFSLGFWLSIFGVFYIFLFLIHFKQIHKIWQFVLVPLWVYLMMLPVSLFIFGNFSLYHPLSIVWTSLFTLFYPLSIFLHLIGFANLLDEMILWLINLEISLGVVTLTWQVASAFIFISLLGIYKKVFVWLLLNFSLLIFVYAIYHVT